MAQEFTDLEVVLRYYWQRHRGRIIGIAAVLLLLFMAQSVAYKVEADSEGVVLRLGKFSKRTQPGLHFKLPRPIDTVYRVPIAKVQALEFGYTSQTPGRRTRYAPTNEDHRVMARMLTADLNLAHVEWVVQYRIQSPEDYLFKIGGQRGSDSARNARELISDVSETVMRRIVGDVSVDSVITTGRAKIAADAKEEMQRMLDDFGAGIKVVGVKLQSATPPDKVKDAFDAVNRAKQNKERVVNDAKGERNRLIPAARGSRDRAIAESEGYALRIVKEAEGNSTAFLARLAEYEKAPAVTRTRLYLEAIESVLLQVDDKIVIDESIKGILPMLQLDGGAGDVTQTGPARSGRKGGGR